MIPARIILWMKYQIIEDLRRYNAHYSNRQIGLYASVYEILNTMINYNQRINSGMYFNDWFTGSMIHRVYGTLMHTITGDAR